MIQSRPSETQQPEPIREIERLRRENRIRDALALLYQAVGRSDLSEETQMQLLHLEAKCHQDSSDYTRAVELDPKSRVARLGKSKIEGEFGLSEDT